MTRALPDTRTCEDVDAVVIRTHYGDEQEWQAVRLAIEAPTEFGESHSWIVDDPSWDGATVDEVLAAVQADEILGEYCSAVFLADAVTMTSRRQALLAVTTFTREDMEDDAEWDALVEFGREFRADPRGVQDIHANLWTANMDFQDFSAMAADDSENVYRSRWVAAA
ncbi:DUF6924 domain-containing protein [Streptomyces anthocyanicus]|uniref:DUF6924 domain-containing protein n=1 Tax=Streptomyces anthocyanicus TaxID=68174 RepID=UPI002F90ECBD|nr:hypothetical protein OHA15_40165 [Streptomyces anthocyanicus]